MEWKEEQYEQLQKLIDDHKNQEGALMPVMQGARKFSPAAGRAGKDRRGLGVTLSDVYGVSTFYSQFALEPKGKNVISVCWARPAM